jgi:hypothetical protein
VKWVQLLATVMILLGAGTGLYYTRWQQNLNDLKTTIDLVSDQNPSGKYGGDVRVFAEERQGAGRNSWRNCPMRIPRLT